MVQRLRLRGFPVLIALVAMIGLAGCGGNSGTDTDTGATESSQASGGATSDSASPAETPAPDISVGETIIEISVSGGVVSPEASQVAVPMRNTVRLLVTSDVADEVHVHGYELTLALAPGAQAELTFLA